ncbi:MAG TPA: fructokinase [Spongiibacteraceae bacterium]|nr:fructokinase [Spongiibacteraceae bacterium]HCS29670.1 fructokinase [Spongiibacteraceae bacterium]
MRIGIDLGGTKIEAVVMSAEGEIVLRRRIPSPAENYIRIVDAIVDLVATLEGELGAACQIGIGTPGAPSLGTGLMKNCNSTEMNNKPLLRDLEQRLGREIRMANDANCFALSEAIDGAGRHGASVFGVILGTGVGGGLVIDQRLQIGRNAIGGEWGHIPMPRVSERRSCYCGQYDCVETYLCGGGLLRTARQYLPDLHDSRELASLAEAGHLEAQSVLRTYSQQLASALAIVVNIVDPDVIVLGGGVSNISALYDTLPELMSAAVFGNDYRTDILPARYGDSSGVRGAAWLWPAM